MKKFMLCAAVILTWKANTFFDFQCPNRLFEQDGYTGKMKYQLLTPKEKSVLCREVVERSKEFYTEEEARLFMAHCPQGTCFDWTFSEKR